MSGAIQLFQEQVEELRQKRKLNDDRDRQRSEASRQKFLEAEMSRSHSRQSVTHGKAKFVNTSLLSTVESKLEEGVKRMYSQRGERVAIARRHTQHALSISLKAKEMAS